MYFADLCCHYTTRPFRDRTGVEPAPCPHMIVPYGNGSAVYDNSATDQRPPTRDRLSPPIKLRVYFDRNAHNR